MEDGQRKQYTEQSQQTIRKQVRLSASLLDTDPKQKDTITKLKKDHAFLLDEMKVCYCK